MSLYEWKLSFEARKGRTEKWYNICQPLRMYKLRKILLCVPQTNKRCVYKIQIQQLQRQDIPLRSIHLTSSLKSNPSNTLLFNCLGQREEVLECFLRVSDNSENPKAQKYNPSYSITISCTCDNISKTLFQWEVISESSHKFESKFHSENIKNSAPLIATQSLPSPDSFFEDLVQMNCFSNEISNLSPSEPELYDQLFDEISTDNNFIPEPHPEIDNSLFFLGCTPDELEDIFSSIDPLLK